MKSGPALLSGWTGARTVLQQISLFLVVATVAPSAWAAKPVAKTPQVRLDELRRELQPALSQPDFATIRLQEKLWTELLDLLIEAKSDDEAVTYLTTFLRANPRAYRYQLAYGQIMARRGATGELQVRAKQAALYAEDDALIRQGRQLAGLAPLTVPPLTALPADAPALPELVLVGIGSISDAWLLDLRDRLAARLPVNVTARRLAFDLPPADRDGAQQWADSQRRHWLAAIATDEQIKRDLKWYRVDKKALEAKDFDSIGLMRRSLKDRPRALKDFNAEMEKLRISGRQWRVDRLMSKVLEQLTPLASARQVFLAVTAEDLYTEEMNFVFGVGYSAHRFGLISARRFSGEFNEDSPHRPRLIERLGKQALSSYGQALGVPRCTDPTCARAYPSNLAELDAKSAELCVACRVGITAKVALPAP